MCSQCCKPSHWRVHFCNWHFDFSITSAFFMLFSRPEANVILLSWLYPNRNGNYFILQLQINFFGQKYYFYLNYPIRSYMKRRNAYTFRLLKWNSGWGDVTISKQFAAYMLCIWISMKKKAHPSWTRTKLYCFFMRIDFLFLPPFYFEAIPNNFK